MKIRDYVSVSIIIYVHVNNLYIIRRYYLDDIIY